jgi:hypothetical protein
LLFFATGPGGKALDSDDLGGNPFASALIEAARDPMLRLRSLEGRLRRLTLAKSRGIQAVERFGDVGPADWSFVEDADLPYEERRALLLVVSDYSGTGSLRSLGGAALDEQRLAEMLGQHGFEVETNIGARRNDLLTALARFGHRSTRSDIAVIYSTGHGIERDGIVYLIPGDYPSRDGFSTVQLERHAIRVAHLASASSAKLQNLVFFGGCRTRPPVGEAS